MDLIRPSHNNSHSGPPSLPTQQQADHLNFDQASRWFETEMSKKTHLSKIATVSPVKVASKQNRCSPSPAASLHATVRLSLPPPSCPFFFSLLAFIFHPTSPPPAYTASLPLEPHASSLMLTQITPSVCRPIQSVVRSYYPPFPITLDQDNQPEFTCTTGPLFPFQVSSQYKTGPPLKIRQRKVQMLPVPQPQLPARFFKQDLLL